MTFGCVPASFPAWLLGYVLLRWYCMGRVAGCLLGMYVHDNSRFFVGDSCLHVSFALDMTVMN